MNMMNWTAVIVAALVPNLIGMIYYNPKVLGNSWQKETGIVPTEEDKKRWPMIMVISLALSFFLALAMAPLTIHQMGLGSLMGDMQNNKAVMDSIGTAQLKIGDQIYDVMDKFRTFKHGAFHGVLYGIFLVLPIVGISAMYEKRSWKYILISTGFWILNMAIMGGIVCAWR